MRALRASSPTGCELAQVGATAVATYPHTTRPTKAATDTSPHHGTGGCSGSVTSSLVTASDIRCTLLPNPRRPTGRRAGRVRRLAAAALDHGA